jgi:hypothetical protein
LIRAAILLVLVGCQGGLEETRTLPAPDEAYFRCRVQPILTKSCGAFACHGDGKRFFRVFGRNRLRAAGAEKDRNAPLTSAEVAFNYDAARAFIDTGVLEKSLLLTKPLDVRAGGAFHRGAEVFGKGDVWLWREDPDFKIVDAWVRGAKEDPSCNEPGSDL